VRIHKTLRVTPAMQGGLTDRVWALPDLAQARRCCAGTVGFRSP
jgi:hypothetical protein